MSVAGLRGEAGVLRRQLAQQLEGLRDELLPLVLRAEAEVERRADAHAVAQ